MNAGEVQKVPLPGGRTLIATPVFDTYWRFAVQRQAIFMHRIRGDEPPWTEDPILREHRFTNAYRASDRVSQYLIREVLYKGSQELGEIFFRCLLFKFFNRIDTWEYICERLGTPTWTEFSLKHYDAVLMDRTNQRRPIYSAAYIMPSPRFGHARKHTNHLALLEHLMRDRAHERIAAARDLKGAFELLRSYPSLGDFLAFQYTVDLNYSCALGFHESEYVVAGPGARDGMRKCFRDTAGLSETEVLRAMADIAPREFKRLGLRFPTLWGRPLQPIDCQNLFCEVDKYARVAHPEYSGPSGRTRIKQKFRANRDPLPQWYPPKWGIDPSGEPATMDQISPQLSFAFAS